MNLILLALIGILESVVMLERYRSANRTGATRSAISAGMVCALRITWLGLGFASMLEGTHLILAACCYVIPAMLGTWVTHRMMEARK